MKKLSADTDWKYVAHNRYWSPAVEYAKQNGGTYDFIIEKGHNASQFSLFQGILTRKCRICPDFCEFYI